MKVLPTPFTVMSGTPFHALQGKFPVLFKKRGLSFAIATLVLLIVITLGALLIYLIVVSPGVSTTTSVSSSVSTTQVYP